MGSVDVDLSKLASEVNKQLLHDVVVMYEANKRVGTVQTKSRGMVVGSTKKLFRQKGTGNARVGNKRTNVRRGGGNAFGKKNRDFSYRLPKKAVRLATRMALLSKFQDNQVKVVADAGVSVVKTKPVAQMFKSLGLDASKTLLAIEDHDVSLWKSSRNISGLRVSPVADLNAYDVLHQRDLLLTQDGLKKLLG